MINHEFWYTDLTADSGTPWFSTHLRVWGKLGSIAYSGDVRRQTATVQFWKPLLAVKLLLYFKYCVQVIR
jgi:hypothetical protein